MSKLYECVLANTPVALDDAKLQTDYLNNRACVCLPVRIPSSVCQREIQSSAGVYTSAHSAKERM